MNNSRTALVRITAILLCAGAFAVLLSGCSMSNQVDNMRASKTVSYTPGIPNFDMEAVARGREGRAGVDVYLGIPYFSFVFRPDSAQYAAPYELNIQILTPDGEGLVHQETWEDTVRTASNEETERYKPLALTKHLAVAPGDYVLRVILRDLHSEKQAVRLQRIEVPDLTRLLAQLGPLRLESRERSDRFQPVVTLHVPSDMDSLRAATDLYNVGSADAVDLTTELIRFRTDDSIADPPYWLTPMNSSLEYRGVDYGSADTVEVQQRTLDELSNHMPIHYQVPRLEPGVYRLTTTARITGLDDTTDVVVREQTRDLSVKSADFPHVASLGEVVDALTYIARDRELENIRQTSNVDTMRRRFDAFWGERTNNKEEAVNLLETYYSRVEEANLYFTTHKAGWKTDRGMLYIVLGAPIEIDYYVDSEVWYYSYSTQDPRRVYVFERGLRYDERGVLFENFVLQRRPYYQEVWQRVINRWRRGEPMM